MLAGAPALVQDEPVTVKDWKTLEDCHWPQLRCYRYMQELRRQLQHVAEPGAIAQWWSRVLMLKYVPKARVRLHQAGLREVFGVLKDL